jgi:hypothetical protein
VHFEIKLVADHHHSIPQSVLLHPFAACSSWIAAAAGITINPVFKTTANSIKNIANAVFALISSTKPTSNN